MRKFGTATMVLMGLALLSAGSTRADPLGGKEPWNFTPVNRAGLAIAIKQVEDPGSGANGGGSGTTVVCGGTSGASGDGATGSGASSTANNSCIIINNSDGAIVNSDQTSDGNQSSSSSTNTSTSNSTATSHNIDDVASILNGNRQGGL
jgi:hypothetical protein